MATPQDTAQAVLQNALNRLAELDAMPITDQLSATFTLGTLTVGFNEYRAAQQAIVEAYTDPNKAILQRLGGPFEIVSVVRG